MKSLSMTSLDIDKFIERMLASNTKKVIFTGTRTDPQLYKYEKELVQLIRDKIPGMFSFALVLN
jgi:hypothetical protein